MLMATITAANGWRKMHNSDACGIPLLLHGKFGMDVLTFPAGGCVKDHTHPGDHILIVMSGTGYVDYDGVAHKLSPNDCYLVPGGVRHGVRACTELRLLAIANDHRPVASAERLELC